MNVLRNELMAANRLISLVGVTRMAVTDAIAAGTAAKARLTAISSKHVSLSQMLGRLTARGHFKRVAASDGASVDLCAAKRVTNPPDTATGTALGGGAAERACVAAACACRLRSFCFFFFRAFN